MRAAGFLMEGPADTKSLLSTLTGNCWSHLGSVSKAEGHSVQKAERRVLISYRPNVTVTEAARLNSRFRASQCFLMAAGVKCRKLGI